MEIKINTEYIKLEQVVKLAHLSESGGQAKFLIQEGLVKLNGDICLQRGKKVRKGDKIQVDKDNHTVDILII